MRADINPIPINPANETKLSQTCKQGHLISGDNAYLKPNGYYECKMCRQEASQRAEAKRRRERMLTKQILGEDK